MDILEQIKEADEKELREIGKEIQSIVDNFEDELLDAIDERHFDLEHFADIEETERSLRGKI